MRLGHSKARSRDPTYTSYMYVTVIKIWTDRVEQDYIFPFLQSVCECSFTHDHSYPLSQPPRVSYPTRPDLYDRLYMNMYQPQSSTPTCVVGRPFCIGLSLNVSQHETPGRLTSVLQRYKQLILDTMNKAHKGNGSNCYDYTVAAVN